MKALLIVDLQNDFCPSGVLPAPKGDQIVPVINRLMDHFDKVLASKDWHPIQTVHFKKWPPHCIQNTVGAEFHPDLDSFKIDFVFLKGTGNKDDGYSAFEATNQNLVEYLQSNAIDEVYVCGLVAEYCVKQTVMDTLKNGFKTYVITDAVEGIYQNEEDVPAAFKKMKEAGAILITSKDILI
ncbi:MAG: nicotinamidase [Eubacteriaceae bacterium]|nr:nicotinamidase [Eubacteriaceae bacterium]